MKSLFFAVCAAIVFLGINSQASPADDLGKEKPIAKNAKSGAASKTVFKLFCGGCSRSMSFHASYASIDIALQAAREQAAKKLRTKITSTDLPENIVSNSSSSVRVVYDVYVKGCKAWFLHQSCDSWDAAKDIGKKIAETETPYTIINHYTRKSETIADN